MLIRLILGLLFLFVLSSCALKVNGCLLKSCQDYDAVEKEKEEEE